jgi:hypothetical protein
VYLNWAKCAGEWCSFDRIDLAGIREHGVYLIWKPNGDVLRPAAVVRVGHGEIASRLAMHRTEEDLTRCGPNLLVTWAEVEAPRAAGVALYLTQLLRPLLVEPLPSHVTPVSANLPISARA